MLLPHFHPVCFSANQLLKFGFWLFFSFLFCRVADLCNKRFFFPLALPPPARAPARIHFLTSFLWLGRFRMSQLELLCPLAFPACRPPPHFKRRIVFPVLKPIFRMPTGRLLWFALSVHGFLRVSCPVFLRIYPGLFHLKFIFADETIPVWIFRVLPRLLYIVISSPRFPP